MKITSVAPIVLSIPFEAGGTGKGIMPTAWNTLDFCLVRIETDNRLVGWGEAFGYFCSRSVAAIIERSIAPLLVGKEVNDPRKHSEEIQRKLVLQGRYGITTFALSGVDIALWDLWAKSQGVSVAALVSDNQRQSVPAYASLVRYGERSLVAQYAETALREGFSEIKLHEITMPEIRQARASIGNSARMTVDVNCNWSVDQTREAIPELIELDTRWLEEPIFPPEDFRTLSELRKLGLAIATGENACTAFQFSELCRLGATDFLQPSITKVGGISEFLKIIEQQHKIPFMPHSPYFGPGYLATLQMAVVEPAVELFEYLFIKPEAWLYGSLPLPNRGVIQIPTGLGLGIDPNLDVVNRFVV